MIDREIGIMMYANHPTIIKFIGFSLQDFLEENNVTIIMELCKNGSLLDIFQNLDKNDGPKDYINTTRQILITGIARGMKYLHDRNIIHRDIKVGNILLDENMYPLLSDFGLSKMFDVGHSRSQTQCGGTLSYMAPEILKDSEYDTKADVYSFGILMFEIVTDSPAYPELQNGQLKEFDFRNKVATANYRPTFRFPIKKSLQTLIEQCWSSDPEERPTFNEIYSKLSRYPNEGIDDENFHLDDVDLDEFASYLELTSKETTQFEEILIKKNQIFEEQNRQLTRQNRQYIEENQQLKIQNGKYIEENQQLQLTSNNRQMISNSNEMLTSLKFENQIMKDFMTISLFNEMPLKVQYAILNHIVSKFPDIAARQSFTNLNELFIYILKFNPGDELNIQLSSDSNEELFTKLKNEELRYILPFQVVDFLFANKAFQQDDLVLILLALNKVIFKVNYPSDVYETLNSLLSDIHRRINEKPQSSDDNETSIKAEDSVINFSKMYEFRAYYFDNAFQTNHNLRLFVRLSGSTIDSTFQKNINIGEVLIEAPIMKIPYLCFDSCAELTKVTLPDTLLEIGNSAFSNCQSLKYINLPSSLIIIRELSFQSCSSLEEINIPDSVVRIEKQCFSGCSNLMQVRLPSSISTIERGLFQGCSALEHIDLPSSVTIINNNAFAGTSHLKNIEIPWSVTQINAGAFHHSGIHSMQFVGNP